MHARVCVYLSTRVSISNLETAQTFRKHHSSPT